MNTQETRKFLNQEYRRHDLEQMTRQELCDLANTIGSNLGKRSLKPAASQEKAVDRAWKVLGEYQEWYVAEANKEQAKPAPKPKPAPIGDAEPKEKYIPMAARPRVIRRLTPLMASTIKKVKAPKENQRLKFWDKYKDCMTLAEVIAGNDLDDTQVRFWVKIGCMKLVPCKDEKEFKKLREKFETPAEE